MEFPAFMNNLALQFEEHKYTQYITNSQSLTSFDKDLLLQLIQMYFKAKDSMRFSSDASLDFIITSQQKEQIDAIMLSAKYSFEAKSMAKNMLMQTFVFTNCAKA